MNLSQRQDEYGRDLKANILLVDDQPRNLLALQAVLEELGQNLVEARSGEEALSKVRDNDFAVVLLDVQMPGRDGFETAKQIRATKKTPHTPIIFLTGFEHDRFPVEQAYALGAVDYLVKPILPVILRAKVAGFVELYQKTQQVKQQAERLRLMERREFEQRLARENVRLQESEERFRGLMEQAPFSVQVFTPDGVTVEVNRAWEELWGITLGQLGGYNIFQDPQLDAKGVTPYLRRAFAGEPVQIPAIEYDPTETIPDRTPEQNPRRWVSAVAYPLKDDAGKVREVVLIHADLTARRRAEEALGESEEQFRTNFELAAVGTIQLDPFSGRFIRANQKFCAISGYTLEELTQLTFLDLTHPDEREGAWDAVLRMVCGETSSYSKDTRYVRKDGQAVWVNVTASVVRGVDGRPLRTIAIVQDLTERKCAEAALRRAHDELEQRVAERTAEVAERTAEVARANEFLDALLQNVQDGIVACNADGELTLFNRAARELHGIPVEPLPPQQWAEHYQLRQPNGEALLSKDQIPLYRALQGERLHNVEMVVTSKDGLPRTLLASGQPFFDGSGVKLGAVVSMHDITLRKQAEAALRKGQEELEQRVRERTRELAEVNDALAEANRQKDGLLSELRDSEQSWRSLAEALPNLVWTDLPDGQCNYLSSQWRTYTGIPETQLLGLNWLEKVIHPDDRARTLACWMTAVEGKGTYDLEYRIRRHDGEYRWFKTRGVPILDDHGHIMKWFGTCTDIEDQKQTQEELRRSEERFRQLADAMPQIVWSANGAGVMDYSNRRWEEFTGLKGTPGNEGWSAIVHPDDREHSRERWAESVQTASAFEMELRLMDRRRGGYRWHLIRTVPVQDRAGAVIRWFGTSTDIDEQKNASEAARFLAEASAALATLVDYEGTLQKVANLAVPYFADWSAVDVAGEGGTLRRLAVAHREPERIRIAQELVRRYPPDLDSPGGIGYVFRTGEMELVPEITDEMLVQGARDAEHLRLMRALGLKSYICVPLIVSGKMFGVLTFATAESARRYSSADLSVAEDLCHRAAIAIKNAHLYAELRQADRLKDEFLAMLAHELRNPLAPVRNALHIIKQPGAKPEIVQQARDMAERQVQHMARLLDDLLDVSRISRGRIELRKEAVDIATLVNRSLEGVRPLIEQRRHELTITLPDEPVSVEADSTRLEQVLSNLLNNAAKYTDPGGHIWLTIERDKSDVVLRVRDTGIGIAAEMLPRIFDLFVQAERRLDRSQGGVGIGLTLVKKLVEMHGGSIEASSAGLGQGSEFVVHLPGLLAPEKPAKGSSGQRSGLSEAARRCVLVVDDNQDAADSLAMILELMGQEVHTSYDGASALRQAVNVQPAVVFLDIGMPGLDGYEVARRLRREPRLHDIVLVALTGWGQEEDRKRSAEAGFDHHLVKPADPDAVHRVLADPKIGGRI